MGTYWNDHSKYGDGGYTPPKFANPPQEDMYVL